jgi:hypothetical protein
MKKPETSTPVRSAITRGKYANLLQEGSNVVVLDPALLPFFPDSASVNRALHAFLAINDQVKSASPRVRTRRSPASGAAEFDPRTGTRVQGALR